VIFCLKALSEMERVSCRSFTNEGGLIRQRSVVDTKGANRQERGFETASKKPAVL
jgi:hypothetical protein